MKFFLIGVLLGFLFYTLTTGSTPKKKPFLNITTKFKLKKYCIHLHHWMYLTFLLVFILAYHLTFQKKFVPSEKVLVGFLVGGAIQGLRFSDRFEIYCVN